MSNVAPSWLSMLYPDVTPTSHSSRKVSALKAMTAVPSDLLHIIGEEGATDLHITDRGSEEFLHGSVRPEMVGNRHL